MAKIIKLTESDLTEIIKKVLQETVNTNVIYEDEYGSVENLTLEEAEYKGRKVQLGKIMQGDVKKFKVYVKNDKGNVVKVNFGFGGKSAKGKRMTIKKNNPERRKSFRARHNCDNPGPRWKPRYWACKTW
jgi:translation initiation factor IF-2